MIVIDIDYPTINKNALLHYIKHEMKIRTFADGIKGCIDIEPEEIPNTILNALESLGYKRIIKRAWVHFMEPGSDHNSGHTHSHDTAVVYLEAPEYSGDLVFLDSKETLHPKENTLAIVPALENHCMTRNNSLKTRIAMAFPIELK